ncbi:PTS transporter subunit EIIC [Vibrio sp. SS-MA-C1-2]|uniref:PTS transporter subunit EIIC n=1 Tax=Vibrio sp. SS-MA-C1-2 TaxID=2908646 RepID=UPI001F2EF5D2|nr:PTS transporter subunit EIIC [Vibrio sp. SS-MA-C1-2]UJF18504.1 PTS transporter subunit EIIC [Vibrio sp. SS-MA-C1-2]
MLKNVSSILSKMSLIGRSLMLPISLLPAAGLLLAFGDKFDLPLMLNAGGVIFDNLPLLFAIGAAVGLSGESGIAALSAAVSMLIVNTTVSSLMGITPEMAAEGGRYALVLGIPTLQMGVFGGLICGILAAVCYNKYHNIKLPEFLGFFAGKRFVPIVTALSSFVLGLILPYIWGYVQDGINALSVVVNGDNQALSTFIFGLVERALIPLGLHHIWYPSFWYSFGEYTALNGVTVHGDQTIWFKMLSDGVTSFSSDSYQGAGKFMQGEFPLMLFALPAACLAMYHEAFSKNQKVAAGILFSAALTCFITGITEPVEFTFIFVAPILYVFNSIMAGLSYMCMYLLDAHMAKSFSAGFIDFISLGVIPSLNGFETNYFNVFIVGIPMAVIYYGTFRFVIRRFNCKTPGRIDNTSNIDDVSDEKLSELILANIGGLQNVKSSAACITRLRLEVADEALVSKEGLEKLGAKGIVYVGSHGIQVILGSRAQFISEVIQKEMVKNTNQRIVSPA